ncbi:MAG: hypothetical protein ACRC37_06570 [Lentisphaeria bacterium]
MIEKMKELTVICQSHDKDSTLNELRKLGVMHITAGSNPQTEDLADVRQKIEHLNTVMLYLEPHRDVDGEERSFPEYDSKDTVSLLKEAWSTMIDMKWYDENSLNHLRMVDQLKPWGQFDGSLVVELRKNGLDVRFCISNLDEYAKFIDNTSFTIKEVNRENGLVYFIVISDQVITQQLPEVQLHLDTSLNDLAEREKATTQVVAALRGRLQIFANYYNRYEEVMTQLKEKEEFLVNRASMGGCDKLAYISGFIPASEEEPVRELAHLQGMALLIKDADCDDPRVPTKLAVPKFARMTGPLFRFLGITPGYSENDVSIPVLIFLTIFFAMLIGDAGYGLLFVGISLIGKSKIKDAEKQLPLNLFLTFSLATVVWGVLTGCYFAIPSEVLPSWMRGLDWFAGEIGENNTKMLCFLIAAVHISLARIWKALLYSRFPVKMLANIGWALFTWGNFFMANNMLTGANFPKFAWGLYAVGGILVALFGVKWNDVGSVINAPFSYINSFVDVLSYIRLFAVGFAALKIAESFNIMASGLIESGGFSLIGGLLVLLLGHTLNIILGFMAVLVHGVRLNTLEFSNHMDITWGGIFFKPFKSNKTK